MPLPLLEKVWPSFGLFFSVLLLIEMRYCVELTAIRGDGVSTGQAGSYWLPSKLSHIWTEEREKGEVVENLPLWNWQNSNFEPHNDTMLAREEKRSSAQTEGVCCIFRDQAKRFLECNRPVCLPIQQMCFPSCQICGTTFWKCSMTNKMAFQLRHL